MKEKNTQKNKKTGDWNKVQKNIHAFDLGYKCGFRDALYTNRVNKELRMIKKKP